MQKKLFKIGNSVALVIDKPLRHALGIKPTTLVRVLTDGTRLIIEPCGERSEQAKKNVAVNEGLQAQRIARAMLHNDAVPNEHFDRLTCGWSRFRLRMIGYTSWVEDVKEWTQISDAERRVVRRMEIVYFARRRQATWDVAVAEALAAEPLDRDDPGEQVVGGY